VTATESDVDLRHALTLGDVLREHRRSRPQQLGAVDGAVRLTFPELDDRVNRLADALEDAGVTRGERVLWLGQNSFRVLELLLACSKLGAMFCPANWRQTAEELAFVIDDLSPRVVVWQDEEVGDPVREARTKVTTEAHWLRHDTDDPPQDADESYEAFLAAGSPEERDRVVDPADGALIIYTAAFAGLPNGAVLSHTACISQGLVYGHFTGTSGHDVYLNSGPLFHLGTFMHTLATFVFGGTNVFVRRVEGDELCRIISEEGCTGAFLVGPIFEQVLEVNATAAYDLSTLRTASVGTVWDAMTSRDQSQWAAAPGGYGQTEAVGMMTFTCLGLGGTGTHGRTSPLLQIRVVDEDDRDVGVGEVGEVATRGPTVMNEYWNRPNENAQRSRNGWHHTNDLGRREADGTITFVGPKGRMIKSAAENIYPVEVERCLAAHDAVADVAIIGVPDAKWVQSVKAIVVVAEGTSVTPDELIDHCRERIASYKKPRTVEFVDALPRDGFLVDYDALDEQFGGGNYPGGRTRSA
jgi:acyl-CoA synthetase (AMP-forming)/AMP-acid ligase II